MADAMELILRTIFIFKLYAIDTIQKTSIQ